jgi:hypothetical protein
MINETLYKSEGREAHRLMQQDRKVFEEVCLDALLVIYLIYTVKVSRRLQTSGPVLAD